jgi:hypothetical protein
MKWLIRCSALGVLVVLGAGYLTVGCLGLMGEALSWALNAPERVLEKLSAWGEAL